MAQHDLQLPEAKTRLQELLNAEVARRLERDELKAGDLKLSRAPDVASLRQTLQACGPPSQIGSRARSLETDLSFSIHKGRRRSLKVGIDPSLHSAIINLLECTLTARLAVSFRKQCLTHEVKQARGRKSPHAPELHRDSIKTSHKQKSRRVRVRSFLVTLHDIYVLGLYG